MRILSFDTSTPILHVALLQGAEIVYEIEADGSELDAVIAADISDISHVSSQQAIFTAPPPLPPGTKHRAGLAGADKKAPPRQEMATLLLPIIDRAVKTAGWAKSSIDCIVVGTGPGGFTAIRTGVVTARSLGQALEIGVIPVSLLECYAAAGELPMGVAIPAGKGHCFAAGYESEGGVSRERIEAWGGSLAANIPFLSEKVAPCYVPISQVEALWQDISPWALAPELRQTIESQERLVVDLPKVKNFATQQAQIAWNRLSLRMFEESEGGVSVSGSGEQSACNRVARAKFCLKHFPYDAVQPLYLRNPSVTLKAATQESNATENQANAPGRHR